jgi:hypothetical protein
MPDREVELQKTLDKARGELARLITEDHSGAITRIVDQDPYSLIGPLVQLTRTQFKAIQLLSELLQERTVGPDIG